ncbi:hypothetical protein P4V43_06905 [Brevibacillus fortis]|nr:hypothetical protein [Brevibacillus fortis]
MFKNCSKRADSIAGVAKTRKVDPATGSVSYVELPQKPHGTPNDYVNPC